MAQRDERRFRAADRNGDMMADLKEFTNFIYPDSFPHMRHIVVQVIVMSSMTAHRDVIDPEIIHQLDCFSPHCDRKQSRTWTGTTTV